MVEDYYIMVPELAENLILMILKLKDFPKSILQIRYRSGGREIVIEIDR